MQTYLPPTVTDLDLLPYEEGNAAYRGLPTARKGERQAWMGYPPDDHRYEDFVRTTLAWAAPGAGISNGVIDFTSEVEESLVHLGVGFVDSRCGSAGWVEADLRHVGSISREVVPTLRLQEDPCHVALRHRELSLVSLDHPTCDGKGPGVFWKRVINPLVELPEEYDHLYGWLAVFFRYAADKPVAYYSRYEPGPMIAELAGNFDVRLLYRPLTSLPYALLQPNRHFRMMNLTKRQWDDLTRRLRAEPKQDGDNRHATGRELELKEDSPATRTRG